VSTTEKHQHEHGHTHDHGHDHGRTSTRQREREQRAEARRLVAFSQIRQFPDPALRERAREIEEFGSDLEALAERMGRLMDDASGVGLAGTQLGLLRRILVYRHDEDADVVALVNPVIVERSDETEVSGEGCLSLPRVDVPVERATSVTVEAKDPHGDDLRFEASGMEARVIQHEIDHLDGVLIIDRTTDEARKEAMKALRPVPGASQQ
jgi:peptide deformylase